MSAGQPCEVAIKQPCSARYGGTAINNIVFVTALQPLTARTSVYRNLVKSTTDKTVTKSCVYHTAHRQNKKVKLSKALVSNSDKATYIRAKLNAEGQVTPLANQESLATISDMV